MWELLAWRSLKSLPSEPVSSSALPDSLVSVSALSSPLPLQGMRIFLDQCNLTRAIAAAALGTTGIFGGFTLMALKAKRRAMLSLGGPLLGCLIGLVLCSLGGMFLPMLGVTNPAVLAVCQIIASTTSTRQALYNINLYGGLALFSVFISYDTQRMIESYHEGNRDHIGPALNMFLSTSRINSGKTNPSQISSTSSCAYFKSSGNKA